jgi:hypothetical protein
MHRRQRTFAELLTRSLATAGLLYALVFAYAVPATLLGQSSGRPGRMGPDVSALTRATDLPAWKTTHGERFPGCVDMARWAAQVPPRTVVVVRRDGHVQQMPFDEAYHRARSTTAADDVWTIGACG